MRAFRKGLHDTAGGVIQRLAAGDHMIRREVSLHTATGLHVVRRPFGRDGIVDGHAIGAGGSGEADIVLARLAREGDDGQAGVAGFQGGDDGGRRFDGKIGEILAFERACPAVEQLDHLGPGAYLGGQVFDGAIRDAINQGLKRGAVGVFQGMGGGLIGRSFACDHVGGDCPWGTCETDQGGFTGKCAFQDAQSLIDRVQRVVNGVGRFQRGDAGHAGDGGKARAFAGFKPQISPKRLRQQQNIGKQDGGIKAVAADGLQGNLCRQFGIVAQFQEIARQRAGGAVFGQVAASLAHHPDRRVGKNLAFECAQNGFGHRNPPLCAMGRMAGAVCQGGSCQFHFTCAMSVGMIENLPHPALPLRIGTRGSPLALWQAHEVRRCLMAAFDLPEAAFAIVVIKVMGDQIQDRALKNIGGKGLFTREIEDALLDGGIDIAVHSMKDMPTLQPDGLIVDCYLPREDVRDAFVSPVVARLEDLPQGALVGSSSLRRRAQLALRRPDLKLVEFRGNVQTRIRKLEDGVAVATFLAMAGLNRLGLAHMARGPIAVDEMLPAVAQGAIGIERRVTDARVEALLTGIHHGPTGQRLAAERAFLLKLDGSCVTPFAGLAVIEGGQLWLRGEILRPDGSQSIPGDVRGPIADAAALGTDLASRLLAQAPKGFFSWQ